LKKLALIGTFCSSKKQIDTLKNTINEWKKLGVDTMVLSPLHLPPSIIELCDYYYYTKDNPLLGWPQKCMNFHFTLKGIVLNRSTQDYGWARLFQMKKLAEIASTYDYNIFYQTEYDLLIDNYVKSIVNSNNDNIITRRINPKNKSEIFDASLHFIALNKSTLKKVKNHITLKKYLENINIVAEGHAIMWSKEFNIPIDRNGFIVDTINNFDEFDMVNHKASNFYWNYSIDKNYKIFFSKNGSKDNLKFNIWDIKDNVEVKINDKKFNNLKEWIVYDSKIRVKDVQSLIINNKDYTSIYKNIYKNLV
tara:strand:+ start:4139 stop:5059 length:921 start_codon:yes stop_codon:yes gene_type:complete